MKQNKTELNATELHNLAMETADSAIFSKMKKDFRSSLAFFNQAADLEWKAFLKAQKLEPKGLSASVLARSAAALAFSGEQYLKTIKYAERGLLTEPCAEIKNEIENLLTSAQEKLNQKNLPQKMGEEK